VGLDLCRRYQAGRSSPGPLKNFCIDPALSPNAGLMPKEALSGDLSQKLRQNRALEGCRRRPMHRTKTKKFSGSALIPRSNSITRTWIPLHCDSLEILHACFISLFHCANPGIYLSCRLNNPPTTTALVDGRFISPLAILS
jgi:hypothetical protein